MSRKPKGSEPERQTPSRGVVVGTWRSICKGGEVNDSVRDKHETQLVIITVAGFGEIGGTSYFFWCSDAMEIIKGFWFQ